MTSFWSRTLHFGLAALMLVAAVASSRLAGDWSGARASGVPQAALLCTGLPMTADADGNPAGAVHCDACLLLAALTPPPPPDAAVANSFAGGRIALSGRVVHHPVALAVYAARAPPSVF